MSDSPARDYDQAEDDRLDAAAEFEQRRAVAREHFANLVEGESVCWLDECPICKGLPNQGGDSECAAHVEKPAEATLLAPCTDSKQASNAAPTFDPKSAAITDKDLIAGLRHVNAMLQMRVVALTGQLERAAASGLPVGVSYNGPHEAPAGTMLWFTDTAQTGGSFLVPAKDAMPERIAAELEAMRKRFAEGQL